MSEPKKVLIWLPLPPQASWRGEGIAQTVENILLNAPPDLEFCLVVSGHHLEVVRERFRERPNIVIRTTDMFAWFFPKKIRKWEDPDSILKKGFSEDTLFSRLFRPLRSISNRFRQVLPFYLVLLQRWGLVFKGYRTIWLPTATLPFISMLKGRKIFSFWDPFVFEYNEFSDIQTRLIKRFLMIFRSANIVTTQSRANKDYLVSVFGIPEDRIRIVNNGAPDYFAVWTKFREHLPATLNLREGNNMVTYWPQAEIFTKNATEALEKYAQEKINQSKLFRLASTLRPDSKVVLISTQYRPYKGFATLFKMIDKLLSVAPDLDLQFIVTSNLPKPLTDRYPWYTERVFEITRVSQLQHAYLYEISDLVLHPSLAEGGLGTYPQFEGASLDVPSLNNFGRHFQEMVDGGNNGIELTTADFASIDETIEKMLAILASRDVAERNIAATKNARIEWKDSARQYAKIFEDE